MAQESQLAHRVITNTALPYQTNVSPANTDPHYISGSSDILTSMNTYAERRPGFANFVEDTPTVFHNLQRLFTWDRFDGTFIVMACDINVSGFAQVYKLQIGSDPSFVSIYTDTSAVPFDFVVSNNTLYFSNGVVAKKWDPTNGLSNWGIAIGSVNNASGPNIAGNGADGGGSHPWTNPNNVTSAVSFATVNITPAAGSSNQLVATQFAFSLPSTETILGIQVDFNGKSSNTTATTRQFRVTILKNGTPIDTEIVGLGTIPAISTPYTVGNSSFLWFSNWTPNDINQTTFGVQIQASLFDSTNSTFSINDVRITVYGLGGPSVAVSGSAGTMTATAGYTYVFCYGNSATGHISSPTPVSPSTGVFTNKLNVSVSLTASTDPQVNQIRVFRTTDGGGGIYFELPNSPFPNTTGAILDDAADVSLVVASVAPTPTFNDPPTPIKSPVYFSGRIWGFVGNKVWFSGLEEINQGVPEESWPSGIAGNFWAFDEPVQGIGLAGGIDNQVLAIFCGGRVYGITGNTLDTFRRFLISARRGTRNLTCVSQLGGMTAWLDSSNQVWASDGSSMQEISQDIRTDLVGLNQLLCSMTFHVSGRFHWLVLSTGTRLYVYDMDLGQWMPPWIFSAQYVFSGETSPGNYVLMASTGASATQLSLTDFFDVGVASVLASDTFNRANQNPINTNWKSVGIFGGVLGQVFNNQYIGQNAAATDMLYDGSIVWPNDQYSQGTLITLNHGKGFAGLYVRGTISPNGVIFNKYQFLLDGQFNNQGIGVPTGAKIANGSVFIATTIITPQSGDVFKLQAVGNQISVFQNNTLILNVADSTIASGMPGILASPVSGVAGDVAWDDWRSGAAIGGTYAPVIKTNLMSVIPDFGSRFSYIGMGSYNEPTRTGFPTNFQITNNAKTLADVAILSDDDPTLGTYTSIKANEQDTVTTYNRVNGINLKQWVYPTNSPASRWISLKVVLANANQVDNIYEMFMAYKPFGGR